MGNVRLYGSTSGYTELAPPAVAPDGVLSLPSGTGTLATLADVAAGGKVLQVVTAATSTPTSTTSTSFVTTGLTASITPSSVNSKIMILCYTTFIIAGANDLYSTIFRDSTNLGVATNGMGLLGSAGGSVASVHSFSHLDSPASVSAITYGMRFRVSASTGTAQGNTTQASITLLEISA